MIVNNPSFLPWRSTLATVLASYRSGTRRAELAELGLARARELGQNRGIGVALRAHARVVGGSDGLGELSESVELLRDSPASSSSRYSLVELGGALRRAGQRSAAREPLREGLALAQRCGAVTLADAAHEELIVSGAQAPARAARRARRADPVGAAGRRARGGRDAEP